jgi:two-component system chemotaxis response regulator CheY
MKNGSVRPLLPSYLCGHIVNPLSRERYSDITLDSNLQRSSLFNKGASIRSLIVEDEFTSRMQIKYFLDEYGNCDIAVNGEEAVEAFRLSLKSKRPYDLICLDLMLPEKNGHQVLKEIREIEDTMIIPSDNPVKIFMTTAMADVKNVANAYYGLCDEYLTKPIEKKALVACLKNQKLIS